MEGGLTVLVMAKNLISLHLRRKQLKDSKVVEASETATAVAVESLADSPQAAVQPPTADLATLVLGDAALQPESPTPAPAPTPGWLDFLGPVIQSSDKEEKVSCSLRLSSGFEWPKYKAVSEVLQGIGQKTLRRICRAPGGLHHLLSSHTLMLLVLE